jgi:hypothetical protein
MEKAYLQYVSGWMFDSFGLKPALGRLDTPLRTGSEGYRTHIPDRQHALRDRRRRWSAIHRHGDRYDDRHLPSHDDESLGQPFRWDLVAGDRAAEAGCGSRADSPETAGNQSFTGMSRQSIHNFLNQTLSLQSAAAGASGMQTNLRLPLAALGVLVPRHSL